jgi:anaerobic magnesium-protoporphyrin IX monomethyl ester cyclase
LDKKKSEIVLVYPPVVLHGRYEKVATGHEVPPQPLLYLGAVLRENGNKCVLVDANAERLDIDETVERILSFSPVYVGITSPTMLISTTGIIAKKIKKKSPDVFTIVGGPHISAVPEQTMRKYPEIDIGVLGEGEITIIELLEFLKKKKALEPIKGIILRENGNLKITEPRPFIKNLDTLPFPAWDMLPNLLEHYQQVSARVDKTPCLSIITSRGCPLNCVFCAKSVFGNKIRVHSAEYLVKMIEYLKNEYGLKGLSFEDENFVVYTKRLIEFCNLMIEKRLNISWDCASNVNAITPELLDLMKKAGCWQINYGIESGSQRIVDFIKKGIRIEKAKEVLTLTKKAGMTTKAYFIIGHPTETSESIEETIKFIRNSNLDIFQMSFMIPFPGSELYNVADKFGEFKNNWDNMNIWTPLFIPKGFTEEDLKKESKRAYRSFYFRFGTVYKYFYRAIKSGSLLKFIKDSFKIFKFILQRG